MRLKFQGGCENKIGAFSPKWHQADYIHAQCHSREELLPSVKEREGLNGISHVIQFDEQISGLMQAHDNMIELVA